MSRKLNSGSQRGLTDISRRGFLKGAGAMVAIPALAPGVAVAGAATDDGLTRIGPGPAPCKLRINGKMHELSVEPRTTLLEVLRDQLDLTGSKDICARGSCGGCTVFIDGRPVDSCLMLAHDAVGAEITTIEGLSAGGKLDPVQAAFAAHDAMQCGYCTPGFVMSVKSLLSKNPKATLDDIRRACSGNLCRCGTYPKVFEAALAAAGVAVPPGNEVDNSGKALENQRGRVDAVAKATGAAKYTADVNLPKMALAEFLECPYGRARLKSFEEAAARAVKGVIEIAVEKRDEYKYCGQTAGYICAESRHALDDAVAALAMKWEVLEPSVDPVVELKKENRPIPPPLDQSGKTEDREKVQQAMESAAHVVEATYQTQIQTHSCLEPHCAVADYRGDQAEIWVSTQGTGTVRDGAAGAFGLDKSKIRVHCEYVGGGFGSKFGADAEGELAAQLSRKLGRPVKIVNDRKREHLDTGCRPGSIQYMKFALKDDGTPSGGQVHIVGVGGPSRQGGGTTNPARYRFGPVVKSTIDVGLTVGDARAMRAPGNPQGMFAVDSFVDEMAAAAGVDPVEYRKQIDGNEIRKRMYEVGAAKIAWSQRPRPDGAGNGRFRRGIGVGVGDWGNGKGRDVQIRVDVFRDGTLRVVSGTQDIGTGNRTVLADVLANHLGIDRNLITADCGNSDYPPGPPSGGSVTARFISPAIRDAADKVREELKKLSGQQPKDADSWAAACRKIPGENFTVLGAWNDKYWGGGSSEAVQFADVEVDTKTGVVRVRKVVALQNCGQAVNRLTVENQIIGGVIQGLSFALFEAKLLDPTTGAMVNPNLESYKILGAADCPEIVPIIWREGEDLGVRSLGEPPVIPTAGAVANAVANALGVRVRSLPITPAKVLAALSPKGGA
jgi:xanthine dehydrogenase YagR molybdenum-binding subunit